MPGASYYAGLTLAEAVERLAEAHADPATRHISRYELDLLRSAVESLRATEIHATP